jgi:hypothetical protein
MRGSMNVVERCGVEEQETACQRERERERERERALLGTMVHVTAIVWF